LSMQSFTDQMGYKLDMTGIPQRIVSLVPSQTELLHFLGLCNEVVGITKFCVHPVDWLSTKTIVGGTKQFNHSIISQLQPDLIIGNKEENYQSGIEELKKHYSVWMSDIYTMVDALTMVKQVGSLTGKINEANQLVSDITSAFERNSIQRKIDSALYLIWRKPWMAAGKNTFIDSMLGYAGFANVLEESRYPSLTEEKIRELKPSYILLSSEPYPFSEKHKQELMRISPTSKILLVDGEMFSWYGSRMVLAPQYFQSLTLSA
jgi:ABC-type Fe3+-hydroxamate transport system substrate-binding protein